MPRTIQRTLALDALCDFVGGSSLSEIALRYRLSADAAEEQLRRGLFDYGFRAARPLDPSRVRGVLRGNREPL